MKLSALTILLIFISMCTQKTTQDIKQQAVFSCIQMCKSNEDSISYENGPCLSDNNSKWNIEDWVCDIAHSPRQEIDDISENQCSVFRNGEANHFVEVDLECNLIKVI